MATAIEEFDRRQFLILNWCMYAAALLTTLLRLIVRHRKLTRLYWDDAFALFALGWLTIMALLNHLSSSSIYLQISLSAGKPPSPPYTSATAIASAIIAEKKMQFAFMVSFWNCLWSAKASLLMFYRRLIKGVDGYMRWWWLVVATCLVTWLISLLTDFMVCLPLRRRFSLAEEDQCSTLPAVNAIWVATSLDIFTDVLVAVLPISLLINLRISLKQKLGIGAIFCLGILVVFFSAFRMAQIIAAIRTLSPGGNISIALWSILEAAVAVVVGSLPTLKALLSRNGASSYTPSGGKAYSNPASANKYASTYGAKGPSVRLYNMGSSGLSTTVKGGYGSDEEALARYEHEGEGGVRRTQEVCVNSEEAKAEGGGDGVEYPLSVHRSGRHFSRGGR